MAQGRVENPMQRAHDVHPFSKVYYRPLEAAIRWSGLEAHEQQILDLFWSTALTAQKEFPQWPHLSLNIERIYDGIVNRELPCGIDGYTVQGAFRPDHPQLTIRHVDLRAWMVRYYPDERPPFLFSASEQQSLGLKSEIVSALVLERDALKAALKRRDEELRLLRDPRQANSAGLDHGQSEPPGRLSLRAETTYLHIIGGLLRLLLGQSPSGQRYSNFNSQESVVSALIAHFGGTMGFTERTLHAKFAAANRRLDEK